MVYVILGRFTSLGFTNGWLICILLLFTVGDIWGLKWFITNYWNDDSDDYM